MIDKEEFNWTSFEREIQNTSKAGIKDSFIEYVRQCIETRKDLKPGTMKNHKKFLCALEEYGKIREISDLTKKNINDYDNWLHNRKDYKQSTIATYHKCMKIYINRAIQEELITINPYQGIKIDRGNQAVRRYLTLEEIEKLKNTELETKSLERVRDLFLFQCNTGLAYVDMVGFDSTKIEKRNERYIYREERIKTGENFYIILLPEAISIL